MCFFAMHFKVGPFSRLLVYQNALDFYAFAAALRTPKKKGLKAFGVFHSHNPFIVVQSRTKQCLKWQG